MIYLYLWWWLWMVLVSGFRTGMTKMKMKMTTLKRREWFPPEIGERVAGVAIMRPDSLITGSSKGRLYLISIQQRDYSVMMELAGERVRTVDGFENNLLLVEGDPHVDGTRYTWMMDVRPCVHHGVRAPPIIMGKWQWKNTTIFQAVIRPSVYARLSSNNWLFLARDGNSTSHYVLPREESEDDVMLGMSHDHYLFLVTREWNLLVLDIHSDLTIHDRMKYSIPMENRKSRITSMDISTTSTPMIVRIAIGSTHSMVIADVGMMFHGNETLHTLLRVETNHIRHVRFANPDAILVARENHTLDLIHWKQKHRRPLFRVELDTDYMTKLGVQHPFVVADSTKSLILWESIVKEIT